MFRSGRPESSDGGNWWDWLNPGLGKEVKAWLIGPCVGVETHWLGRTQPCRRYVTGGRLACYCEKAKLAKEWKGYVPLLDENGVQCIGIIGRRYEPVVSKIQLFKPVVLTRLKRAGCPVMVKASDWTDADAPTEGVKQHARDLKPWLLRLWKDKELIDWLNAHTEESKAFRSETLVPDEHNPTLEVLARRQRMRPAKELPATLEEALGQVASKNGKGKH